VWILHSVRLHWNLHVRELRARKAATLGAAVRRFGTRVSLFSAIVIAGAGLPMLLASQLAPVLIGLALIALGTFFAQAVTTGYVGRNASQKKGAASGLYLACYFLGGLFGSALLGQLFDRFRWTACVTGIGTALLAIGLLASRLNEERKAN
jgi:predicted MFS family arabinose efflux permease